MFSNHVALGASARHTTELTLATADLRRLRAHGIREVGHPRRARGHDADGARRRASRRPQRYAGYTQVFYAPVEWLVTSVIGEQADDPLAVNRRTFRWRPEVQARLTDYITITASARTDMARVSRIGPDVPGASRSEDRAMKSLVGGVMRKLALWISSVGWRSLAMAPVSAHVLDTALGGFVGPLQVVGRLGCGPLPADGRRQLRGEDERAQRPAGRGPEEVGGHRRHAGRGSADAPDRHRAARQPHARGLPRGPEG